MNWLAIILGALPSILTAVKSVETAIGSGNGASKKAIVISAIQAGAQASEGIPIPQVQAIGAIIDSVVTAFNKSGVFSKSALPQAADNPTS